MKRPPLLRPPLGLAVAVVLLGSVELALRLLVPRDALVFSWERSDAVLQVAATGRPDEVRLLPKPSSTLVSNDGAHAWLTEINTQGFRGARDTVPADRARYRVLAVGDSWVYGTSTSQGHTFVERLEAELGAVGGRPVEMINAGVPSFSAFDMLARYHEALTWLQVDAVVVGLPHNASVQRARAELRDRWYAGMRAGPTSEVRLYLGLRLLFARLRTDRYAPGLAGDETATAAADLRALVLDATGRGLDVVVVAWPSREGERQPLGPLLSSLALPPAPVAAPGLAQRSCYGFTDLGHPSEAGAAVAAQRVAAVMSSRRSDADWVDTPSCDDNDAIGPTKPHAPPRSRAAFGAVGTTTRGGPR